MPVGLASGGPAPSDVMLRWFGRTDIYSPDSVRHVSTSYGLPERAFIYRRDDEWIFPTFPGFAVDTAFYGATAFTLWSAPGAIRRHRRQARGHCPACGYDLKGAPTATCPECGA